MDALLFPQNKNAFGNFSVKWLNDIKKFGIINKGDLKMKEFNYRESIKICEQALDYLDVKKFLRHGCEPNDIMTNLEEYVNAHHEDDAIRAYYFMKQYPEVFSENAELFNYMTDYEFIDYCKKRYPEVIWASEFIERYWVANNGTNS